MCVFVVEETGFQTPSDVIGHCHQVAVLDEDGFERAGEAFNLAVLQRAF